MALPRPPVQGTRLRIFLVEAHPLYIAGLQTILGQARRLRIVGTASSVEEGHRQIERLRPDLVLMDLDEEDLAERTVRAIKRRWPQTMVVGLSDAITRTETC